MRLPVIPPAILDAEIPETVIADFQSFIKTGEGPSLVLDNWLKADLSRYSILAQHSYTHRLFMASVNGRLQQRQRWPLEYALLENPLPRMIQYLLENGAGSPHNKAPENKNLFYFAVEGQCSVSIFHYLLAAGYQLKPEDVKKIYK